MSGAAIVNGGAEARVPVLPHLRLEPSKGWVSLKLGDLWAYRELIYFFVWRDIKVRYKQTALGAAWAIIQPLFTMVVFSVFFGKLGKMGSDGVPYPIFAYVALVPWTFFQNGLTQASTSLVENSNLIKKVYFPRLAVPISTIFSGLVDFAIAFTVLLGMMVAYNITPTINILWLPAFLLLTVVTSLGVGLWISALNVQYRDFRYVVPFLAQAWMMVSPVVYSQSLLEEPWQQTLYGLNPMVGVISGFRWALLGGQSDQIAGPGPMLFVSAIAAVIILIGGLFYFRRMEKTFADVV